MLVVSWFSCRWCVDKINVRRTVPARAIGGVVALVVLMIAEMALGLLGLRRSLAEQVAAYVTGAGVIGLAAQAVFPLLPMLQGWRR